MRAWPLLVALAVFPLLCGCAGADRPLTLEEFYGFCWPAQIESGCWDDNLCADYRDYLAQEHAGKQDCIDGCNELQRQKYSADAIRGCSTAINTATDWCTAYCRRSYDANRQGGQP